MPAPPGACAMTIELLIAGIVHMALFAAMAALPQQTLLRPARGARLALGLAYGVMSILLARHSLSPYMPEVAHVHPGMLASAVFLFGPAAGAVAALAALAGPLLAGAPGWGASLGPAACSVALGTVWWAACRCRRMPAWMAVTGLAATLPVALLPWLESGPAAVAGLQGWLQHGLPWRYVLSIAALCGGTELLRSRARSMIALRQREEDLLRALRASGGGRWEWDVRARRFSYHGRFYRAFGLADSPDDGDAAAPRALSDVAFWERWNARCHPEDMQRVAPYLRSVLDGHEEVFHAELRMRDKQGRWRWLIARGRAVEHGANGHVQRLAGIALDVTEHHEMREALRASEAKYTTVYQTLPDAAGITRLSDGCYLDVNPAFERMLGLPRAQIVGRTSMELGVWNQEHERARLLDCLRTQGEVRGLPMTAHVGSEDVPGLMSARTTLIDGEQCLVFVFHDMTQEQRVRDELLAANQRLARLFQVLPYPLGFTRRGDGAYIDVNPAWEQAFGFSRDEALGRTVVDLGLYTAEARARLLEAAAREGQLVGYEVGLTTRAGARRTVLQSMIPIDVHGEACWLFALHDITERKQAEQRVREREELLSLTIAAASLGLWDWDLAAGTVTGDARWRAMTGQPPATAGAGAAVAWTSGIVSDDIDAVTRELRRHMADPGPPFDVTCQVLKPGDGGRWIRSLGKIVARDANGRPVRMVGMSIDVSSQRAQEQQLERMAHYDALTGLPNRVMLERRLREGMAQYRAQGLRLGVGYLDLDGFKPVNDRLGHAAGDRLLVVVAERLKRSLRLTDCVARLGGDEFVILLPGLASSAECEQRLRAVMDSICAPYTLDTERVLVTASIGYTLYPDDSADADTLLRHADQAMYAAKQAGRNRFHAFDAAQERERQARREQSARLAQALACGELALYLQPKVDMRRGTVVGAEALARWLHPQQGMLAPAQFLHLIDGHAELQAQFGEWVVDAALAIVCGLMRQGLHLPVSINITSEQLHRRGFADWMASRMALHPEVPARLLALELTESAALYDIDHVAQELAQLRALGMAISFDDFGTGYSSLAYLRRLPLDHLKLDRSFVAGMEGNASDRAIVQGVIGLAQSFGCDIVAEGVETIEQGRALLRMGCGLAQGYCIARPMPAGEFPAWAAAWQAPGEWLNMNEIGR